jgi:hypothetical protein
MGKSLWTLLDAILGVLFWAVLGALVGGFLAYYGGVAYGNLANISDFEGGYSMGVVFVLVLFGAVLGVIIGTAYGILRWRRWRAARRS